VLETVGEECGCSIHLTTAADTKMVGVDVTKNKKFNHNTHFNKYTTYSYIVVGLSVVL
jgi:hypothetical protein